MKLGEFDYNLPKELIAQYPAERRDEARMMVLERKARSIGHKRFSDLHNYLDKGDCLILNNTKVIPARLFGRRKTGGKIEIFVMDNKRNPVEALVRPSGRLREGENIILESGDEAKILGRTETGRLVEFDKTVDEILQNCGHVPLPPYISRCDKPSDRERYQTVFASHAGATASPTAGLHFTEGIIDRLKEKGVRVSYVTLHVSYGTFAPVLEENIEDHRMHKEYFELPKETIEAAKKAKDDKKRIVAVGTTTTRVLESNADKFLRTTNQGGAKQSLPEGDESRIRGWADLFIYPGYRFRVVDSLLTNFHLPKSTLLMLVSAFADRDFILKAYEEAIKKKYRFFSYGDCMLIL